MDTTERNAFFVENQSMDLMNSLGSVSSVNAVNYDASNGGHDPLIPDPNSSITSDNNYIQDSMISNVSMANCNYENTQTVNTQSVVYNNEFLQTDYEEPTCGLLSNDVEILQVAQPGDANKCCSKCVVM
eukprot:UN05633